MKKKFIGVLFFSIMLRLGAEQTFDFLNQGDWHIRQIVTNLSEESNISESFVRTQLGFKEGDLIRSKNLEQATKQLHATGWVNRVQWEMKVAEDNLVDIYLKMDVCDKISNFKFEGNKSYGDESLIYEMKSRVHEPLNFQRIKGDEQRLKEFYISKGYTHATVCVSFKKAPQKGYSEVYVQIKEGDRLKIKEIYFEGVHAFKQSELLDLMRTKTWGLFSWLTKTGRYNEDLLLQDLDVLRNYYANAGFLDVDIDHSKIRLEENGERLRIIFNVNEGIRYYLRNIDISLEDEKDVPALQKIIALKTGDIASPEKIEDACENIRNFYGKQGFIATVVKAQRTCVNDHELDLRFTIEKGNAYSIHSVRISGNVHTKSKVILRELSLAPGDVLDRSRMKRAEQRLQNTGFFKNVLVTAEDSNIHYEKDLKVAVEENKTGSIFFSGGINSVEKLTLGVTLSQNNFDYQNSKDYFRGAGQKFQVGTSWGKYTSSINLSFEEPWLYDRELRFGFNLFHTTSKVDSDNYKEKRLGGEVYLGKRLFERVEGRLYYHLEQFKLSGVNTANVSPAIKDEAGSRIMSKVGFLLERDTRDQFIYPTRGTYLSWDNQLAGLGGKTKYFRSRATAARWFLINPEHEQVFLIGGKTGWVRGFGGKEVPLFEREFLGGPDDLRGFDYREVGPKTNDKYRENLGGKSFFYLKSEYSIKVHSIVRVLGFFDLGKVNKINDKYFDPKSGGLCSDVGLGLRIHVMGAPLRLDFAWPLKTDAYNKKKGPHIAYSFGVSF